MHQIATKQLLSNWSKKITVHLASNGEEALKKVEDTTYDLILLDLQMPVMDGLTAAAKIREDSQVPIIALTTNASKQEEKKCQDLGINDYLAKPFQPEDLFHKVMQQLHRAASES